MIDPNTVNFEARMISAVKSLIKEAGLTILDIYKSYEAGAADVALTSKADDSPLTQADLAAHVCIVAGLAKLTPKTPVVSEECAASLDHRLPEGQFWLIDPLDGTKEFLAKNGEFTVNIALISDGLPVFGVVYAPVLDLLYWGGRGFGAFLEVENAEMRLQVAEPVPESGVYRVVASKSHLNAETEAFIERLGAVSLIQAGSSLKLCRVAEGAADVYPRLAPTCEWDTAAAQAVVEGADGFVVDIQGKPLVYGKADVLNPSFVVSSVPLEMLVG
jgi:3'(2'), 5'-bisphosphate nucleotidase